MILDFLKLKFFKFLFLKPTFFTVPPFRVYICVVRSGKYRKLDTVPCFCWSGSATDDGAAASASDAAKPDDTAHVTGTPTNKKKALSTEKTPCKFNYYSSFERAHY